MGNAPLSPPPRPTDYRVVIPIATKRRFGTKLVVFPILSCPDAENNTAVPAPLETTTTNVQHNELPLQLESSGISSREYQDKMHQVEERLALWKGGWATLLLGIFCFLVVVSFIAGYLTPAFWSSALFRHPGYIVAMATGVLCIVVGLVHVTRRESQRLVRDVQDLYRSWRGRGVHVIMKHVSSVESPTFIRDYTRNGRMQRREGHSSAARSNCFCIIMTVVNSNQEGDNISVGTVMTDDSECGISREEHDKERFAVVIVSVVDDAV